MNSRDPGSNLNISSVDTGQGGCGSQGYGGGTGHGVKVGGGEHSCGIGWHGLPSQDMVETCTHITKSYYFVDQCRQFSAT